MRPRQWRRIHRTRIPRATSTDGNSFSNYHCEEFTSECNLWTYASDCRRYLACHFAYEPTGRRQHSEPDDGQCVGDSNVCTTVNGSTQSTQHCRLHQELLVFNRDMVMDIPLIANLETIRDRRQQLIDENLRRQNERRIEHHYKVGDKINLKTIDPVKLSQRLHGPFFIVRTNTNGTVTIQRAPNVQETLSIRKIVPYKGL